jgi:hypothetical protein
MNGTPPAAGIDAAHYPDLRKWVISSLSGHKKPNEIIFQLCQRTGWDWNQATSFVEQVTQLDQKQVHQRRMPLLLAIGLFMLVGGILLFLPAFLDLMAILSQIEPPLDLNKIMTAAFYARTGYILAIRLVTGMAMIIGGGWGIWSAVRSAITGEGDDLMSSGPSHTF